MQPTYDFKTIIPRFDAILKRGLCTGLGTPTGQMCIEAAITQAMDLPFNDEPKCVEENIRTFKIALNDQKWSTEKARAKGLRNIGIAQIGSKGVVDGKVFLQLLSTKLIKTLIPDLFKKVFKPGSAAFNAGLKCSEEPTAGAAYNAAFNAAATADYAAAGAAYNAAAYNAAYNAARAADYAARAARAADYVNDYYLIMVANLALECLKELKSPGCEWI